MRASQLNAAEVRLDLLGEFISEINAPVAAGEPLHVLRDDEIFDTPGDDAFGRVIRLAASIYHAPVALIALGDEERVWSQDNLLTEEIAAQVRDLCLCSQVAATGRLFWTEDARQHPLLMDHPLVVGDFALRFFATAPLLTSGDRVLGVLCIIDHQPRTIDPSKLEDLLSLAGLAANELELRRDARRRMKMDRQFNEERYQELFDLNPQPLWVYDVETLRFLAVNTMAVQQYGYSREEFLSMTLADLQLAEDAPALRASLSLRPHRSEREYGRHRRRNGSIVEVEISSSELLMARRPARLVVACDVTDRGESKHALQSRDRYLAALVQVQRELLKPRAALDGLEEILGKLGKVSGAGRVYYLEHLPATHTGKLRADWCVPHGLPVREDLSWHNLIESLDASHTEQLYRGETVLLRADDEKLPPQTRALFHTGGVCSALLAPLLAGGRFHGVLGFDNCVSQRLPWTQSEADHLQAAAAALALALERESTARALADEKERLLVTLASVTEGVITTDLHGNIVLMNRVAEELTGHSSSEALGRPIGDVFSIEEDKPATPPADDKPIAGRTTAEHNRQVWLWTRAGDRLRIAKGSATVYDERGMAIGAVNVFRDITQQEKITEELLKASKLESIGILAGGIAHDFNNILTAVIGNLSLTRTHCKDNAKAAAKLDAAERACFRARDLTGQLLTFARGGEPIKKLAQIGEMIRESIHFALHGSTVHSHFSLADDLWPAEVDIGQIGQVINNLGINAVQAMPRGGIIEVLAENLTVTEGGDFPVGIEPGHYVKICVEDDGSGIAPEHVAKIFDPFFTTKESGSGLGLATSYSIIKKHDGYLQVDSVRGVGSIFRIYLPAQPKQAATPATGENSREIFSSNPSPGGSLRVLIMDDEAAVRDLAQAMFSHLGHETVGVPDGTSAINAYRQGRAEGRPFDLVILDLTVPGGMGGRDALDQLRKIEPRVMAVVSSGYSNNPIMSDHESHGFRGVLAKPYRVNELANILHELFEAPETA